MISFAEKPATRKSPRPGTQTHNVRAHQNRTHPATESRAHQPESRGDLAFSRAARAARMAGYFTAVQADVSRHRLGCASAVAHDGRAHARFWENGEVRLNGCALLGHDAGRVGAVALLFKCAWREQRFACVVGAYYFEGVFSTAHHPYQRGAERDAGYADSDGDSICNDAFLRRRVSSAFAVAAAVFRHGFSRSIRGGCVVFSAECEVSRCEVCRSVHRSHRHLRDAGGLFVADGDPAEMVAAL